jgi:hypothetical protein
MSAHAEQARPGNLLALRHGADSERVVTPRATTAKRRLLRQVGLRAADLDGIGRALLDNWARSQAKVELMDEWYAINGFLDGKGVPHSSAKTYWTALNSAQRAISRFADHVRPRVEPSMVAVLQGRSRRAQ